MNVVTTLEDFSVDRFAHAFEVLHYFVISESQLFDLEHFEKGCSNAVVFLLAFGIMAITVQFNAETRLSAQCMIQSLFELRTV